jgi:hypothetical protein
MADTAPAPVLLIDLNGELPEAERVWGTGGWQPPERREALDWLTLARLLGWSVRIARGTEQVTRAIRDRPRWIIAAGEPEALGEDGVSLLASCLEAEPMMIVARSSSAGSGFAHLAGAARAGGAVEGRELRWRGAGPTRTWHAQHQLQAQGLTLSADVTAAAVLDGAPCIAVRDVGRGAVATLGFHPSRARDADGTVTALLRHLLVFGSRAPVASLDFADTMVLRMDDPGGAQNVHLTSWLYSKLGEQDWAAIGQDLRERDARLSIGYTPGWVDDGDRARGELSVAGRHVDRIAGAVHESPLVTYIQSSGERAAVRHDYGSEFRGIQALRAAGLADVELHGFTHMHPDTRAWATATDRYDRVSWFRELGATAAGSGTHALTRGVAASRQIFGIPPTTLIPPGDEWTNAALELALALGLHLVSSYYLALRDRNRFCWTTHVCAPYLDRPDAAWFHSGLPVVGFFHDRDVALAGPGWMAEHLDRWESAGARRFIDFRELAAAVGRRVALEEGDGGWRLVVASAGAPPLVRPLAINMWFPDGPVPETVTVRDDDRSFQVVPSSTMSGVATIVVPVSSKSVDAVRD